VIPSITMIFLQHGNRPSPGARYVHLGPWFFGQTKIYWANTKTQNDYLRDYEGRAEAYLHILLKGYAMPDDRQCCRCHLPGLWRCRDCFGGALFCRRCCRNQHLSLPLHRLEKWNGSYFEHSALWEVGVRLHLGHQGFPCPSLTANREAWDLEQEFIDCGEIQQNVGSDTVTNDDEEAAANGGMAGPGTDDDESNSDAGISVENPSDDPEWDDGDEPAEACDLQRKSPPTEDSLGGRYLVIVDSSGIHRLSVLYCGCTGSGPEDEQLFGAQFFPATFTSVATVFSFQVLNDFRADNLECKTTPYQFYQKLRRVTNASFPKAVPNRYAELRRVSRQWRQLSKQKWYGMQYDDSKRGPGEMALFCAACPQPGVNLKPVWIEDKNKLSDQQSRCGRRGSSSWNVAVYI